MRHLFNGLYGVFIILALIATSLMIKAGVSSLQEAEQITAVAQHLLSKVENTRQLTNHDIELSKADLQSLSCLATLEVIKHRRIENSEKVDKSHFEFKLEEDPIGYYETGDIIEIKIDIVEQGRANSLLKSITGFGFDLKDYKLTGGVR